MKASFLKMSKNQVPPPRPGQTIVKLSAFEGGIITLPENMLVAPASPGGKMTVPSLAFLITHPTGGSLASDSDKRPFRMMFDLGLRSNIQGYIPEQRANIQKRVPFKFGPSIAEQLQHGGLNTREINLILLSHVHYDHHGDPELFPTSTFVVGNGTLKLLKQGMGGHAAHQLFDPDLLPNGRVFELPPTPIEVSKASAAHLEPGNPFANSTWAPLGPFEAAIDVFGDGSAYIVNAPGHLAGHVNMLCRTENTQWVYLASDACHDKRIMTGEKDIGTWENNKGQNMCIHNSPEVAKESIERIRALVEMGKDQSQPVEVILAHDPEWLSSNEHRHFPNGK